jgi:hypothetical protein
MKGNGEKSYSYQEGELVKTLKRCASEEISYLAQDFF